MKNCKIQKGTKHSDNRRKLSKCGTMHSNAFFAILHSSAALMFIYYSVAKPGAL